MRVFISFLQVTLEESTECAKTRSRKPKDVTINQMGNYHDREVHTSHGKWREKKWTDSRDLLEEELTQLGG